MIDRNQIPPSWKIVKLGEVCTYSKGKKPPTLNTEKNKECSIPYINIKAFEKGIYDEYTNGEKCNLCNDDDLLMVWDGARCGLIGKAKKGAVGSTLMKILPKENIHKEYLYHFISSIFWTLNTKPKGVGIPHIEPTLLWNFELVVPPLPEQHRIVSKIEELFSELDKGIESLKTAQQQLKVYRQTVLKWAFEGKLTNKNVKDGELPKGWKYCSLKELKIFSIYGPRFSSKDYSDIGVAVLRTTDISERGKVDWGNSPKLNLSSTDYEKYKLIQNDLLITRTGSIGRLSIFNDNKKAIPGAFLIHYRLKDEINVWYIFHFLKSQTAQKHFKDFSFGVGRPNLNVPNIELLQIPLPPFKEQQLIVDELEGKLTVCDNIEETITHSLQQSEALRQSILKKAFEGKLVEQNPKDEPASKLLERIKTESTKNEVEKKKSRRDAIIIGGGEE